MTSKVEAFTVCPDCGTRNKAKDWHCMTCMRILVKEDGRAAFDRFCQTKPSIDQQEPECTGAQQEGELIFGAIQAQYGDPEENDVYLCSPCTHYSQVSIDRTGKFARCFAYSDSSSV